MPHGAGKKHISFELTTSGLCVNSSMPYLMASSAAIIVVLGYWRSNTHTDLDTPLHSKCRNYCRQNMDTSFARSKNTATNCRDNLVLYSVHSVISFLGRHRCSHWTNYAWSHLFYWYVHQARQFLSASFYSLLHRGTEKKNTGHPSELSRMFCYCRKGEQGAMVLCDNSSCQYGWFHLSCVNLSSFPKGAYM